ncbi:MAG: tRNA(Ile)(2)-agmatinylcytidine synthase, partial [Candidatus Bathyarchaeia archaeon]
LVERLAEIVRFIDYPLLVRLNPNIPWKTRGNAAVCLRVEAPPDITQKVKDEVVSLVEEHAEIGQPRTDPGIVFLEGQVPPDAKVFAKNCLIDVVSKRDSIQLIKKIHAEAIGYGSGRGIIGALASIGNLLEEDHTYELLAYRKQENCGKPREIDEASVFMMDANTKGRTFNNVDLERRRVLITPRGPDPVLLGIRGEAPMDVKEAFRQVVIMEEVERWVIFRTNQGTDMHLPADQEISSLRPYITTTLVGVVTEKPRTIRGGHVLFRVGNSSGEVYCAAYEPSGGFRGVVSRLEVGDHIRISGGVRPRRGRRPITVNLERLEILNLAPVLVEHNPTCPFCNKRMESMGRGGGYRCRRCGLKEVNAEPTVMMLPRSICPGLYLPPPRAQRHLTKPAVRYGKEKTSFSTPVEKFWGLGPNN